MRFFFIYCSVCSSGYFSWRGGPCTGWWIQQLQITGSAVWKTEWSGQLAAKWGTTSVVWEIPQSVLQESPWEDDKIFTLIPQWKCVKIKMPSWHVRLMIIKIVLEMVLSKNQIIISSGMKLYTLKMGKILHIYMYRLYITTNDLELCLFTNSCQQIIT